MSLLEEEQLYKVYVVQYHTKQSLGYPSIFSQIVHSCQYMHRVEHFYKPTKSITSQDCISK